MRNKKALIVLGGSKSHTYFVETAKSLGLKTVVFDKNKNAECFRIADYFFPISTHDYLKIKNVLKFLSQDLNFIGVLTYTSDFVSIKNVLKISNYLKIKNITRESIEILSNKYKAYNLLRKNEIEIPKYFMPQKPTNSIGKKLKLPLIAKPAYSLGGSLGINYIERDADFKKKSLKNKQTIFQSLLSGKEFNIGGIVSDKKIEVIVIVRKFTHDHLNNFIHLGYTIEKILPKDTYKNSLYSKFVKLYGKTIELINADNYFFNIDVLVKNKKIFILDVGFLFDSKIDRLLYFSGIDPYEILINIVTKNKKNLKIKKIQETLALAFFYANKNGKLKITNDSSIYKKNILSVEWNKSDGDIVNVPKSLSDTLGWIIFKSSNFDEVYIQKMSEKLYRIE